MAKKLWVLLLATLMLLSLAACNTSGSTTNGSTASGSTSQQSGTVEKTDFNVSTKTGTVGQLHNSIVAFNDSSDKYNVIVETVSENEENGLYTRTYALWDSKDVNEFNFQQYMIYSGATAKISVTSADFSYNTRISGFTLSLPWYGISGMSAGDESNKQLAVFARCVIAGIMPDLDQQQIDSVCEKLHILESDFDNMAKAGSAFSKNDNLYIARFGPENMNFVSASYNSAREKYELLFDNLALSADVPE